MREDAKVVKIAFMFQMNLPDSFVCGGIPYLNAEEGQSHSSGKKPSLNVPPSSRMVRLTNLSGVLFALYEVETGVCAGCHQMKNLANTCKKDF